MKCRNCNLELPDNAKFCFSCGAKVGDDVCMNCGAKVVEGARFCMMCGASLNSQTYRPETDHPQTDYSQADYSQTDYSETDHSGTVPNLSASVNLQTGTNTLFGALSSGKLTVSESGVAYVKTFGTASSHSYSFSEILNTEFKMTRTGLQPWCGYKIYLKNGTEHTYIYSPLIKSKIKELDQVIRSQIE